MSDCTKLPVLEVCENNQNIFISYVCVCVYIVVPGCWVFLAAAAHTCACMGINMHWKYSLYIKFEFIPHPTTYSAHPNIAYNAISGKATVLIIRCFLSLQ